MPEDESGGWLNFRFIILGIIVFVVFYLVMYLSAGQFYAIGTATINGQTLANSTAQRVSQQHFTAGSIFLSNFLVSAYLIIPALGLVSFLFVLYNTGQVFGLLAAYAGVDPFVYLLATAIPVGILEVAAYAVLGGEGLYLLVLGVGRNGAIQRLKKHSWKSFLLYLVLLFTAAIVEAALIGAAGGT
jgi:uncharacterized membrane protein SpoIIM required for sporulation